MLLGALGFRYPCSIIINFDIWFLVLEIFMIFIEQVIFINSVNYLIK